MQEPCENVSISRSWTLCIIIYIAPTITSLITRKKERSYKASKHPAFPSFLIKNRHRFLQGCLRCYKRKTPHSKHPTPQWSVACRDMMKSSILLVFLALGYVASAAPEIPFGSNIKQYLDDTPPLNDDESASQEVLDEMEELPQEDYLQKVKEQASPNFRGESATLELKFFWSHCKCVACIGMARKKMAAPGNIRAVIRR